MGSRLLRAHGVTPCWNNGWPNPGLKAPARVHSLVVRTLARLHAMGRPHGALWCGEASANAAYERSAQHGESTKSGSGMCSWGDARHSRAGVYSYLHRLRKRRATSHGLAPIRCHWRRPWRAGDTPSGPSPSTKTGASSQQQALLNGDGAPCRHRSRVERAGLHGHLRAVWRS